MVTPEEDHKVLPVVHITNSRAAHTRPTLACDESVQNSRVQPHTHTGPTPKWSPAWTLAHSPVLKQNLLESGVVAQAVECGGSAADYSV